jgi:hypothetical protein
MNNEKPVADPEASYASPAAVGGCGGESRNAEAQAMDSKPGETPPALGADSGDQSAPEPAGGPDATREEVRLDFLKQAIAFTEWTIRSFDTKAQISIAAFVLSINPLWSMLTSACPRAAASPLSAILLVLLVVTILLFGYVIWPVALTQSRLTGGWQSKGLFYVGDPTQVTTSLYAERLKEATIEVELAAETLKLAYIREIKSSRFKNALKAVVIFYAWAVLCFLLLRGCA